MLIAIIPARGGSKRLPKKNIKPLHGKSLLRRAIERALESGVFSRVIVSTDDHEMAEEAVSAGAEVPFIRPAELASDSASSVDVVCHAVNELIDVAARKNSSVCLMQPTSPLLTSEHIKMAVDRFFSGALNSLSTMTEVVQHPEWVFHGAENGLVRPTFPADFNLPANQLSKNYIENGAVYLVKVDWLMRHRSLYDMEKHGMLLMSRRDSIDIDTQEDWELAEFYLGRRG